MKRYKTKEELEQTEGVWFTKKGWAFKTDRKWSLYPVIFGLPFDQSQDRVCVPDGTRIVTWDNCWAEDWMLTEDKVDVSKVCNKLQDVMTYVEATTSASRHDTNKLRLDLLPVEWQIELSRVLTFGAKKYEDDNWRKGMKFSRAVASGARHLIKWRLGHKYDEESGCHHLAHAAWNLLALMSWEMAGLAEFDDRHKSSQYNSDLEEI